MLFISYLWINYFYYLKCLSIMIHVTFKISLKSWSLQCVKTLAIEVVRSWNRPLTISKIKLIFQRWNPCVWTTRNLSIVKMSNWKLRKLLMVLRLLGFKMKLFNWMLSWKESATMLNKRWERVNAYSHLYSCYSISR